METIQDLLNPTNDNISIVEDPKSGDVSLPGASLVEIRNQQSFVELLRLGEAHRFAANTKLNAESSRSHAILMVNKFAYTLFDASSAFETAAILLEMRFWPEIDIANALGTCKEICQGKRFWSFKRKWQQLPHG